MSAYLKALSRAAALPAVDEPELLPRRRARFETDMPGTDGFSEEIAETEARTVPIPTAAPAPAQAASPAPDAASAPDPIPAAPPAVVTKAAPARPLQNAQNTDQAPTPPDDPRRTLPAPPATPVTPPDLVPLPLQPPPGALALVPPGAMTPTPEASLPAFKAAPTGLPAPAAEPKLPMSAASAPPAHAVVQPVLTEARPAPPPTQAPQVTDPVPQAVIVEIGRLEIRLSAAPVMPAAKPRPARPTLAITLGDYLSSHRPGGQG